MTSFKLNMLLFLFVLMAADSFAQSTAYKEADQLLNIHYKKLYASCDSVQKVYLKDEQLEWLSTRDDYFKQTLEVFKTKNPKANPYKPAAAVKEDAKRMFDSNTVFVQQRAEQLSKRCADNYSENRYNAHPTGLYGLGNEDEEKTPDTYGEFGNLAIREKGNNVIEFRLYVCNGAPSYHTGLLSDTAIITGNKAVYTADSTSRLCTITFYFYKQGVSVSQTDDGFDGSCGFGQGVSAGGFFKRKSYDTPSDAVLYEQ